MSTERILIRGSTAQRMEIVPALGQIGSDDDLGVVILGDGATPGGIEMARRDQMIVTPTESVPGNLIAFGDELGKSAIDSGFKPQESLLDITANALMRVGAFGLGGDLPTLVDPNLNDDRPNGAYYCNNASNAPGGVAGYGYFIHRQVNLSYMIQEFANAGSGITWIREKVNGVWRGWDDGLPKGAVVNSAIATYSDNVDLNGLIPFDDTTPLVTEGVQILSLTITPTSITNKLRARFSGRGASAAASAAGIAWAIFRNSSPAIAAGHSTSPGSSYSVPLGGETEYAPASLTPQTISVRVGSTQTIRMNGSASGRFFGTANVSTLVVEEIKA